LLADEGNMIPHEPGAGQIAFSYNKRSSPFNQNTKVVKGGAALASMGGRNTCNSHFIEPMEWIAGMGDGSIEGKISCPKCASKLGSYNWSGIPCSCGTWVSPAFVIHKNKVDT
jgi:dual specificity phosphatase 12